MAKNWFVNSIYNKRKIPKEKMLKNRFVNSLYDKRKISKYQRRSLPQNKEAIYYFERIAFRKVVVDYKL